MSLTSRGARSCSGIKFCMLVRLDVCCSNGIGQHRACLSAQWVQYCAEVANGDGGSRDLGIPGILDAELVGSGGSARVYRATQAQLGRIVAVKVLIGSDPAERKQFDRESMALGRLASHPGIVAVHDAGLTELGDPYLLLEFCSGGPLSDRIKERVFTWTEAVGYLAPVAETLAHAHAQGFVHRDLKPGNILLDDQGRPLIADFGLARMVGANTSSVAQPSMAAFTPGYVPPETISGEPATPAGDVYSLGGTMYSLLSGLVPFVDTDSATNLVALARRIVDEPVPDLRPMGVPDPVCALIEQCMSKNPAERPTAHELHQRLVDLQRQDPQAVSTASSGAVAPPAVPPVQPTPPPQTVPPAVLDSGPVEAVPQAAAPQQAPQAPSPQTQSPTTFDPQPPVESAGDPTGSKAKAALAGVLVGLLVLGLIALGVVAFYLIRGEELPSVLGGDNVETPIAVGTDTSTEPAVVAEPPTAVVPPTPRPTVVPPTPTPIPQPTATPQPTPPPVPTVERGIPVADVQSLLVTPSTVTTPGVHSVALEGGGFAPGTDVLVVFCDVPGDEALSLDTDVDELVTRIQLLAVDRDCDLERSDFVEVDANGDFSVDVEGVVGDSTIVLAGATDQSASAFVAVPVVP